MGSYVSADGRRIVKAGTGLAKDAAGSAFGPYQPAWA